MFRSSLQVAVLAGCNSILGYLAQLLLARHFGLGYEVDAYFFALSAPTFAAGIISGMLSYLVVPRLVSCEGEPEHHRLYMGSLVLTTAGFAVLFGIAGLAAGWLQSGILPEHSRVASFSGIHGLILLAWVVGGAQILLACLVACLNSVRTYLAGPPLLALPSIGMTLILLTGVQGFSVAFVLVGTLLGTLAGVGGGVYLLRRHLLPLPWRRILWPEMKRLLMGSPYTLFAMSSFNSFLLVDAFWAPRAGEGALTSLALSQRLVIGLGSLVISGPSAVLVPRFAEYIRDKDYQGFRRFLVKVEWIIGGLVALVAALMAFFAPTLTRLLFARGAFGSQEVAAVSGVLRALAPGMVAMLMSVVAMRALFCVEGALKAAAGLGLSWTVCYFTMSWIFWRKGAAGIAAGYSLVWILFVVAAGVVIARQTTHRPPAS